MKIIIKFKLLTLLLLVAVSCNYGRSLDEKLEGLTLATKADLIRLGELELNSSNVPAYNQEGKKLNDKEMLEVLDNNQYKVDYYLDKNERLGAIVIKPGNKDQDEQDNL
jgi:hypothetical protein